MKMPTLPKPGRGRPRSEAKRRAIVVAAGDLFLTKGFERASMDDVAKAAGVSKQTVYSHFQTKERLYAAVIRAVCEDYFPDAMTVAPSARIEERLVRIGHQFVRLISSEPAVNMFRMLVARAGESARLAQLFYEAGPELMSRSVRRVLDEAVRRGELRVSDTARATAHFASLLKGELHFKLSLGLPVDLSEAAVDRHVKSAVALFLSHYRAPSAANSS